MIIYYFKEASNLGDCKTHNRYSMHVSKRHHRGLHSFIVSVATFKAQQSWD